MREYFLTINPDLILLLFLNLSFYLILRTIKKKDNFFKKILYL